MKTNISPSVMQQLVQQAQEKGVSVDDLILTLLNRQSSSEFEIFERITDAFFALDAQWHFIYMNHEAENLLQRHSQDLIGKNIWDEFPEARGGNFQIQYENALQSQLPVIFVEFYPPLDTWFEVHAYPSENGLSVYFRDVTLRKNLEIALQNSLFELEMRVRERTTALQIANDLLQEEIQARRKAEAELQMALDAERQLRQAQTLFVSMISHEFKTPLTSIRLTSDMIAKYNHRMNDDQRERYIEKIQAQVIKLNYLLETILLFNRSQSKGLELKTEPTNIKAFCHSLIQEMQAIAGERHIIHLELSGDDLTYELDKHLTAMLIGNLISNAVKYSPKGGKIWVQVDCQPSFINISVKDTGIGIPADDIPHVFENFYRAKNVGTINGTGLGLTLIKKIVDLYGGHIDIESTVNIGTVFKIHLPVQSVIIETER
jgi:PAS domain S-box-containing protein